MKSIAGRSCLFGDLFAFDVADHYAFDIDEPVDVTLTYAPRTHPAVHRRVGRNGGDGFGRVQRNRSPNRERRSSVDRAAGTRAVRRAGHPENRFCGRRSRRHRAVRHRVARSGADEGAGSRRRRAHPGQRRADRPHGPARVWPLRRDRPHAAAVGPGDPRASLRRRDAPALGGAAACSGRRPTPGLLRSRQLRERRCRPGRTSWSPP